MNDKKIILQDQNLKSINSKWHILQFSSISSIKKDNGEKEKKMAMSWVDCLEYKIILAAFIFIIPREPK